MSCRSCRPSLPHPGAGQPGRHPHRRDAGHQHPRASPAHRHLRLPAPAPRFTNRDLLTHLAALLGLTAEDMTSGQISYDMRRLRIHGVIERIPAPSATRPPPPAAARQRSSPASLAGCSSPA